MDNTKENKQTLFLFPLIHYLTVLLGAEGAEGAAVGKMVRDCIENKVSMLWN